MRKFGITLFDHKLSASKRLPTTEFMNFSKLSNKLQNQFSSIAMAGQTVPEMKIFIYSLVKNM